MEKNRVLKFTSYCAVCMSGHSNLYFAKNAKKDVSENTTAKEILFVRCAKTMTFNGKTIPQ